VSKYAECGSCGYQLAAIKAEQVVRLDAAKGKLVWRCPVCGHLTHSHVSYLHEPNLDWKPGRSKG
jgi:uncharacterized Zn finger protein